MYFMYGTMYVKSNTSVISNVHYNTAQIRGGAIYIESGVHSSIIVDKSAKILFFNNSAFQGGALYVIRSSFAIKVGHQLSVQFINNTAFDVGGAVYSEMQLNAPCMFMVTDYSAELSFTGNYANCSVGHHMYGISVRDYKCDKGNVCLANIQGKPYCWYQQDNIHEHINISLQMRPSHQYPLLLGVCASVTQMVNHSARC